MLQTGFLESAYIAPQRIALSRTLCHVREDPTLATQMARRLRAGHALGRNVTNLLCVIEVDVAVQLGRAGQVRENHLRIVRQGQRNRATSYSLCRGHAIVVEAKRVMCNICRRIFDVIGRAASLTSDEKK